MSDEQPQPSLRLTPRSVPAASPPPALPVPVPQALTSLPEAPATDATITDPSRLRLKPKTPSPDAASIDTSGITFSTPQPFSAPPIPTAEVTSAQTPVGVPPPSPPAFPSMPGRAGPPQLPEQILPRAANAVPYIPTPSNLREPRSVPVGTDDVKPVYKADKWLAAAVIFVLVLVGAVYGVRFLMKANPKPKSVVRTSASTESNAGSTEQNAAASGQLRLVDNPVSAAGKAVARARDLVASRERFDKEQGVERILDDTPDTVPGNPSANAVSIVQPPKPVPAPAPVPEPPPVPPSDAFRQFVASMRVSGVFQGENARAMLNGKMYSLGDVVDTKLDIVFYKIDVEAKQLIFRDDSGAIMPRRY